MPRDTDTFPRCAASNGAWLRPSLYPDWIRTMDFTNEQLKKKKRRSALGNLILVVILLLGLAIIAYPTFSDWWNSLHQSRVIASYASAVDTIDTERINEMIAEAQDYNAGISQRYNPFLPSEEERAAYEELLDFSGTGIMGYIQITDIGVNLPIYHGTGEGVLQTAIGHLEWTSLPVGGDGTHCVVSGHRGLPSARLFTDLDKLREKDTFTVTVLNQTLTYEVDQIRIVLPQETEELMLHEGEDLFTLVTCTPYGINTHRMLVRGHRIYPEEVKPTIVVLPDAVRIPNYIAIPAVGIPMLFLFLLGMIVYYRQKSPPKRSEELLRELEEFASHRVQ